MRDTILFGDCRETLKQFDEKARTCITSPPYYGLRDYGGEEYQIGQEQTPDEFIEQLVSVFREVRNILTDDGTLWVNLGDSYYNYRPGKGQSYPKQSVSKTKQDLPDKCNKRGNKLEGLKEKDLIGIPWLFAFAMRNDGWYLRQDIIWHKPNPMPESVRDRCTKSHEYIFLFSKNKKYYYNNEAIKEPAKDWGTRDRTKGKYHNKGTGLQPHSGLTKSYPTKNKRSVWTSKHGKYVTEENEAKHRQGIHANRGENLVEVRTKLPIQKQFVEFIRSKTKAKILAEHTDIKLTKIEHWFRFDEGGFAYPSIEDWKKVRDFIDDSSQEFNVIDEGLSYYELKTDEVVVSDRKNKRSVWSVTNKPYKGAHFATYPPDLIEPCILAGSEVGDIVLDPFMGSGTTAMVAKSLGRDYIGCELHEDYGNLIKKRVEEYKPVQEVAQEPCINILDII